MVQRCAWFYMKGKLEIGFPILCISDTFSMLSILIFLLEGSTACDVRYKRWKEYSVFTVVFTVISTYTLLRFIGDYYDLMFHLAYSITVAVHIIDVHVLSCNQIRVNLMVPVPKKPQENQLILGESFMV
ncbi:hypothetical protein L5515_003319 [Caenorhabditis briggsae]|nr:hypothetical protein L5515_003319 [Caenorhabditis briggsae]